MEKEQLVKHGVSFRLGKLFGHPRMNQRKLTEYIIQNDNLILDCVEFNPTSLNQAYKTILYELKTKKLQGIYNLANKNLVTPFEYGIFINKIMGSNKKITMGDEVKRIFHNNGRFSMSLEKISKHINLTDWKEDMIIYLKSL